MFHLRLRQAQTALKDGRLDEALELAGRSDVRDHRDGQRLVTKLVAALVERGRSHLEAGRLAEAGRDCRNARQFGGNLETVAALSADLADAERRERRAQQHKAELIREAEAEMNRGAVALGGKILGRAADSETHARTMDEWRELRRERIEAALQRARDLAEGSSTAQARAAIFELEKLCPDHEELPTLIEQVVSPVLEEARGELDAGRLDRATRLLDSINDLPGDRSRIDEMRLLLNQATRTAGLLEAGQFADATIELRKMMTVLGEPDWLANVFDLTSQAASLQAELRSTPLSLLGTSKAALPETRPARARAVATPVEFVAQARSPRYILQVDGGGSFLLLPSHHVRIGRSNQKQIDIPLQGFSAPSPVAIERSGDEYLIRSDDPFEVDRRSFTRKLLDRNESIAFGRRCRIRFRRPNPAATSAVLELSSARLSRPDIRGVVLLDDSLVIGPKHSAHVSVGEKSAHGVLFLRDGEFYFRRGMGGRRNSSSSSSPQPVPLGAPVDLDGTRLTVSPVAQL